MNYDLFKDNPRIKAYKSTFRIYVKYDSEWFCSKNGFTFENGGLHMDGVHYSCFDEDNDNEYQLRWKALKLCPIWLTKTLRYLLKP